MKTSFEEILKKEGKLTYSNVGNSMFPMLRSGRDIFTIVKKSDFRLKENDVALFKYNGKYLLHRVICVCDDSYTMRGDNCINSENNIKDSDVLGVLISFQRNGKRYSVGDKSYLLYVYLMRLFEKPRIILKKGIQFIISTIKRLLIGV